MMYAGDCSGLPKEAAAGKKAGVIFFKNGGSGSAVNSRKNMPAGLRLIRG